MNTVQLWAGEAFSFEAELAVSIDGAELTPEMAMHALEFGLRQMIRDAGAGAKNDTERNALARKKLSALMGGTLRAGTGGGQRLDPITRRAKEISLRKVEGQVLAKGLGWTRKKMGEYAEALFKRDQESLMAEAAAELEAVPAEDGDILAGLGL